MTTQETDNEKTDGKPDEVKLGLRHKSLKVAGISFFLADSALIVSGLMSEQLAMLWAGVLGLTSGFVGARYGNPKAEKQLEQIYHHLGAYLRKEGVEIPKNPTTESLTKEGGLFDHIESFIYAHPSQVINVLYSLVGVQFVKGGRAFNDNKLVASGGLLIAGALGGILIPETKPEHDHPNENVLQKTWSWIQEKPLRVTGTLFTVNQGLLALNALSDKKAMANLGPMKQNSYVFKLLAVAAFTFGNIMMAISSKAYGGGSKIDEKTLNALSETTAQVIAAQPKEVQNALLEHVAGYLSNQPNIKMKADEISGHLHKKLAEISQTHAAGWQGRVADSKTQAPQPSI